MSLEDKLMFAQVERAEAAEAEQSLVKVMEKAFSGRIKV
jgi:hypothetical protein